MKISNIRWETVREIFEYLYPLGPVRPVQFGREYTKELQEILWKEMKEVAPNINEAGDHPTCSLGFQERRWNWTVEDVVVTAKLEKMAEMSIEAKANNCKVVWNKFMFGGGMIEVETPDVEHLQKKGGLLREALIEEFLEDGIWQKN